ncbi:hypothetical protein KKB18_12630, partial [bacterium]|nr:hypothetical protein [bacterium]
MRSSDHRRAEYHTFTRFLKSSLELIGLIVILGISGCSEMKTVTRDELLAADITKLEMKEMKQAGSAVYLSNLGWAYLLQGKGIAASSREFEDALKLDSTSTYAQEGMAYIELLRGNHGKSIGHLIEAIKNRENLYEIIPLLNLCYSMSQLESSHGSVKNLCNDLIERNDIPLVLKSDITWILSNLLLKEGNIDEAKKLRASLGFFNDWLILGPFGNSDEAGYDITYPPEAGIDYNRFYKVGNREIKWFEPAVKSELGFVQLDAICYPHNHSTIYSLVYINSPEEIEAVIRFGTSAKYKLWLNESIAAEHNQYRDVSYDQDTIFVSLRKGWNKILIKFCNDEGALGFYFRITDLMGNKLNNLTSSTKIDEKGSNFAAVKSSANTIKPRSTTDYFKDLTDKGREQLFPHFYIGLMYLFRNPESSVSENSFVEFKKCIEYAPKSSLFYYFMGNSGTDFSLRADALEKAHQEDGECTSSLVSLGKEFFTKGLYSEAQDLLLEAISKNPEDPLAHYYLGLSLFARNMDAEGIKSMEMVSRLAPYFSSPYYEIVKEGKELIQFDRQSELLDKAMEFDFLNNNAREELVTSYVLKDDVKKAVGLLMERLNWNPYDYDVYLDLADIFSEQKDYESGIFYGNKGLEIFNDNPIILAKLGDLKYEAGDIQNVGRYWQKSLEIKKDKKIEEKLSSIGNNKDDFYSIHERRFETIKDMFIPDEMKNGSSSIVLFNQRIRKLNNDYT